MSKTTVTVESTDEGQVAATEKATEEVTAEADVQADTGTGMIGKDPDNEIPSTDTSLDTPIEELTPLFDEQAPSEAELSGDSTEEATATEKKEEGAAEETEKAEGEAETSEKEPAEKETKSAEEETKEEVKADGKPPAGYVPHAALHEERVARQELRQEVADLRQELAGIKQAKEVPAEDAFKVMSDEEFDELAEEDPSKAVKYQRNLDRHLRAKDVETAKDSARGEQNRQDQHIINSSFAKMDAAVPGLRDESNSVNGDLRQFAVENGFDADFLSVMTAPGTLILPEGAEKAVLLGDGAAGLVDMIYRLQSSSVKNDPKTLRATIKAELLKELTPKITEELMKKFKSPAHGAADFKSLGDVPGGTSDGIVSTGGFTEAQYAAMPPEQRDKLLGA